MAKVNYKIMSWHKFLKAHKGTGLSLKKLSTLFKNHKNGKYDVRGEKRKKRKAKQSQMSILGAQIQNLRAKHGMRKIKLSSAAYNTLEKRKAKLAELKKKVSSKKNPIKRTNPQRSKSKEWPKYLRMMKKKHPSMSTRDIAGTYIDMKTNPHCLPSHRNPSMRDRWDSFSDREKTFLKGAGAVDMILWGAGIYFAYNYFFKK